LAISSNLLWLLPSRIAVEADAGEIRDEHKKIPLRRRQKGID
jgi:hypothetical protein